MPVIERMTAWECTGCGRIEGARPCVGICQDRKVEFVYAFEHEAALAQLQLSSRQVNALVRQLVVTHPHDDGWEKSFRAFQQRARAILAAPDAAAVVD